MLKSHRINNITARKYRTLPCVGVQAKSIMTLNKEEKQRFTTGMRASPRTDSEGFLSI